ncbi:MAG TPA: carbohydrate-binding domain-containing protein [Azospirillaceae bacterium]|nr:carbohydrate-binding domain-containing protein [Azospirillaceae bacterium]
MAYTRIIENLDLTSTLVLEGSSWDNTLVRNVTVHNASGDGILLKNVKNVRIENCVVRDVTGTGIKLSGYGSTENVVIADNTVVNTGRDGIAAPQNPAALVNHTGLKVLDNVVTKASLSSTTNLYHGIMVQATDSLIEGNKVYGTNDGNGISVRSSGILRGNEVHHSGRSGIAYFPDSPVGASKQLVIENNLVSDSGRRDSGRGAIDLLGSPSTATGLVGLVQVRNNELNEINRKDLTVDGSYAARGTTVQTSGNVLDGMGTFPLGLGPTTTGWSITNAPTAFKIGTAAATTVVGGTGADWLDSGTGTHTLRGGAGDDTLIVRQTGDRVLENAGEGDDTVVTRVAAYTLPTNVENLTVGRSTGATATGNALNNILVGGRGADTLNGAGGRDWLIGGEGDDRFIVKAGNGNDTIADFKPGSGSGDVIRLEGSGIADLAAAKAAMTRSGANVSLKLSSTETLTIRNTTPDQFIIGDFDFGTTSGGTTGGTTGGSTGGTTTPPPPPPPSGAGTRITVSAWGSPAGGVWPSMTLLVDGQEIGRATVSSSTRANYNFVANITPDLAHKVQVRYDNDTAVSSEDRALYVDKVLVNNRAVESTSSMTTLDRGALDGQDVVAGRQDLLTNGALVFNLPKDYFYDRPQGPNAPWNIPVNGLPRDPNSAKLSSSFYNESPDRPGNFNVNTVMAMPVFYADDATGWFKVDTSWSTNIDGTTIPWNPRWQVPGDEDARMIILDPKTGREWNLWHVTFDGTTVRAENGSLVPGNYHTYEGGNQPSRGVGIEYSAMLVRPEEIKQGLIDHALAITISNTDGDRYVAPATKLEHPDNPPGIPEGTRFALNITDAQIDAWSATLPMEMQDAAEVVARALRDYGWFITDTSGGGASFEFEARASAAAEWDGVGLGVNSNYGRDLLDGLIKPEMIYAIAPSTQYVPG